MMYFLRLGLRNVFRQRLRTGLALGAIALSVAIIVVGASFTAGVERFVFNDALGEAGEIVVAREDWFARSRFNPLKFAIPDADALVERLAAVPGVRAAVPRIDFGLLVQQGEEAEPVLATAVDVLLFARFSALPRRIVAGRYLQPDEKAILLGATVAEKLGVGPGDRLIVLGRTAYDSFMGDEFEVAGVFDMGMRILNRATFLPLAAAQEFLDMPGAASRVLLYAADYREADALAARIRAGGLLPEGVAARPWTEDALFGSMHQMIRAVRLGLSGIICFVAGLGILNMMMVSVLERRREIGVLMALGMSRPGILVAFLYEALIYGVLGSALGVLLGAPLAAYLERTGIEFRADEIQGLPFPMPNTLHADFGPESLMLGVAVGLILSLLGMLWPMLKTFSMKPIDAMAK
jgi:ABC-type lipoprotein release transport system permease subunit